MKFSPNFWCISIDWENLYSGRGSFHTYMYMYNWKLTDKNFNWKTFEGLILTVSIDYLSNCILRRLDCS